jgi:hypothetical protein
MNKIGNVNRNNEASLDLWVPDTSWADVLAAVTSLWPHLLRLLTPVLVLQNILNNIMAYYNFYFIYLKILLTCLCSFCLC